MSNLNKLIFLSSLMTGTIISISSYSWMGMWMGLEINLLAFIPLISSTNNMMNSEAALKYFITQAMASTILLFSIIYSSLTIMYNTEINNFPNLLMNTALLTKMGAAPFHFWFPEVIEGISWMNSLILLTWQKIAPLIILSYINKTLMLISFSIISSMLISGLMVMNQNSLRKILAYSSINHLGWMLSSMIFIDSLITYYFSIYFITTASIILILNKMNIFFLSQLFISMNNSTLMKTLFSMNFLSLGGLPPFLGFLPKWLVIQEMVMNKMILIPFMMIILTLIMLFFYLQISLSILILSMSNPKYYKQKMMKQPTSISLIIINFMGLILCTLMFNFN
uniref:NADH-ubiquinone oxidoreductase chain 2 n=1 Tax=Himaloaesalus gaoligongshanus TaxID=2583518 RepID=A0A7L4VTE9_9SCAR|nr:NADH dehydrogenase subunit 2 [Himaloaesalus gaoligongshanus]QCU46379.1 NADH dehydrogenase subunit 2 [Himaloaesalus gaoligongshanus]WQF69234.1 NADH dehydrogenase subunit 2 [Himaloaesalus gaoligongshanus]